MKITLTRTLMLATAVVVGGSMMAASADAATIHQRRAWQQHRIAQGVASGQLTAGETARLERREAAIGRELRVMRSDGGLTCRERAVVNNQLNRLSRRIWVDKHNGRIRF